MPEFQSNRVYWNEKIRKFMQPYPGMYTMKRPQGRNFRPPRKIIKLPTRKRHLLVFQKYYIQDAILLEWYKCCNVTTFVTSESHKGL